MRNNIVIAFLIILMNYSFINITYSNPNKIIKNVICKEKQIFKKYLEEGQNEKLLWYGISNDGSTVTELYVSNTTNKWTILETDTKGISCATIGGDISTFLN